MIITNAQLKKIGFLKFSRLRLSKSTQTAISAQKAGGQKLSEEQDGDVIAAVLRARVAINRFLYEIGRSGSPSELFDSPTTATSVVKDALK